MVFARRNLVGDRTRLLLSALGVAASDGLSLLLWLEGSALMDTVTMATDPTWGMTVQRKRAAGAERDAKTFLRSRGCREEFPGGLRSNGGAYGRGAPGSSRFAPGTVGSTDGR